MSLTSRSDHLGTPSYDWVVSMTVFAACADVRPCSQTEINGKSTRAAYHLQLSGWGLVVLISRL